MNKQSLILAVAAMMLIAMPAGAKQKVTKEYQRPSLHMVLLNTDEPTSEQVEELLPVVNDSWTDYEFPTLYNQFTIPFQVMDGGKPKGNMIELVTRFGGYEKLKAMKIDDLMEIQSLLAGKQYNADLKLRCDSVGNEIAHQLIAKWFNIKEDSSTYSCDTIFHYACYSAQQMAANTAAATTEEGAQMTLFHELMQPTIANTYVSFSKLAFYANEPIAAFTRDLAIVIGELTAELTGQSLVAVSAKAAAMIAYEASKGGYSAYSTSLLYRLNWNDSIYNEFSKLLTPDDPSNPWSGKIDMAAFKAMNFNLEYLGVDKCNSVVTINLSNADLDNVGLTRRAVHKNLNKQLVRLQNKHEEFKPMVPIVDVQPKFLVADMGTKESVKEGEVFDVINGYVDEKGITTYKIVGQVKVQKKGVWDNEAINQAEEADKASFEGEENELEGTKLAGAGVKNAQVGMFVKRQRAKKQKK